jgi:hypothetical protein
MKKALCVVVSVGLLISIALFPSQASGGDLGYLANGKSPIKVFLKDFSNESGQPQADPATFMKEVEKAFVNRKSVSFAIAKSPGESDVQVSAVIKSYQYLERDPVRPSPTATLILDAVTSENFAEMSVEFTVADTKSGETIWKDSVTSYVKRMMTPAEGMPVVSDKVARNFVGKAFGKGR